jgi:hypothetical protein
MSWHIIDINHIGNIHMLFDRINDTKVGVYKQLYNSCSYECFWGYAILNWIEENTNVKSRKEATNFGNFLLNNHYILAAQPGVSELEESNFYYLADKERWSGCTSQNYDRNILYSPRRAEIETLDNLEDDTENDILTRDVPQEELSDVNNDSSLHDLTSSNYSNTSLDISTHAFSLDPPSEIASSPFEPWNDNMDGTFINFHQNDASGYVRSVSTRTSSIRVVPRSNSDEISFQSPAQTSDPTNTQSARATISSPNQWTQIRSSNGLAKSNRVTLSRELLADAKTNQQIWRKSTPTHVSTLNIKIVRLSHYRRFKRVL